MASRKREQQGAYFDTVATGTLEMLELTITSSECNGLSQNCLSVFKGDTEHVNILLSNWKSDSREVYLAGISLTDLPLIIQHFNVHVCIE